MGLNSDTLCPYCYIDKSDCRHLLFCPNTKMFWEYLWEFISKSGIVLEQKNRLFGYSKPAYANDIIFIAHNILSRRFLFNINSVVL